MLSQVQGSFVTGIIVQLRCPTYDLLPHLLIQPSSRFVFAMIGAVPGLSRITAMKSLHKLELKFACNVVVNAGSFWSNLEHIQILGLLAKEGMTCVDWWQLRHMQKLVVGNDVLEFQLCIVYSVLCRLCQGVCLVPVSRLVKSPPQPGQVTELRSSFALNSFEKKLEETLAFENLSSSASALRAADPRSQCTELYHRLRQEVNRSYGSSEGNKFNDRVSAVTAHRAAQDADKLDSSNQAA